MKFAAIDIGSNTVRLLVATVNGGELLPLRHERRVTRLAAGLHSSGVISSASFDATVSVIEDFVSIARAEGANRIRAVATSALREASNGRELVIAMEAVSGLRVEVISGQEEAGIMSMGVLSGFDSIDNAIIFDIGGGSTEFIAIKGDGIVRAETFPVGVVSMLEKSVSSDPPAEDDKQRLDKEASLVAVRARERFRQFIDRDSVLIATAGTATTLASLDLQLEKYDWRRVQGYVLSLDRLRAMEGELLSVSLEYRRKFKGMDPGRADLIIAGVRLTIKSMEALGFATMTVSDHGLLEGLVVKLSREALR